MQIFNKYTTKESDSLSLLAERAYNDGVSGNQPRDIQSDIYMTNFYQGDLERRRASVKADRIF